LKKNGFEVKRQKGSHVFLSAILTDGQRLFPFTQARQSGQVCLPRY
jgi:hypothetical protein